jgi:heme-degrading monooxygenase HmoA
MVLEIAQIDVRPGDEEAFIKAYAQARALVAESPGQWRGLIGPYFASPPQVEHFADL